MNRRIFILVPSPEPSGPVKGAVALANALVNECIVTLVTLKCGSGVDAPIDPRVVQVSLADVPGGFIARIRAYAKLLAESGARKKVASISMCFSADMVNLFCRHHAIVCASIRGNLLANYRMHYGFWGIPLAIGHLFLLRFFDHAVVMTAAMAKQVRFYVGKYPTIIGNFVDENALEPYREKLNHDGIMRFVFLGSLTERKQPLLLIWALSILHSKGFNVWLDVIGDGPLMPSVLSEVQHVGLSDHVCFHGYLKEPHFIVGKAHALVLPSLSEGVSRAALEALYLGVPCVMRKVDGNAELIQNGFNGVLFENDEELPDALIMAANSFTGGRKILIPDPFRQYGAAYLYRALVNRPV